MDTEKKEAAIARSAVAGWYVTIAAVGLWRALIWKKTVVEVEPVENPVVSAESPHSLAALPQDALRGDRTPTEPNLQDLQARRGAALLDRLARTASVEHEEQSVGEDLRGLVPPFTQAAHAWKHDSPVVARTLRMQALDGERLEGWSRPQPDKLPLPTFTPAIMAFGIVLFAMGLATTWYVCVAGAAVFAVAAWRWVGELQED